MQRRHLLRWSAVSALACASPYVGAQTDVSKLIVGFPAGGLADAIARFLADYLGKAVQRSFIVENKPGASTTIAAAHVKRAPADGKTLLFAPSTSLTLLALTKNKLPYQPDEDFVPISKIAVVPNAIAVPINSPYTTLAQYVDAIKQGNVKPQIGVAALGAASHIALVGLGQELGVTFEVVPYQGGAAMTADLLGGHIPAASDATLVGMHKAGKVRMLAISTPQRFPVTPDVPTFEELGYQAFRSFWYGVWAPVGTPPDHVQTLQTALSHLLDHPANAEKLLNFGVMPSLQGGAEFGAAIRQEREILRPIVLASGYKED